MPIRRWVGWCAICRRCQEPVDFGDGMVSFETRNDAKECLDRCPSYQTIEQAIEASCGCKRKEAK